MTELPASMAGGERATVLHGVALELQPRELRREPALVAASHPRNASLDPAHGNSSSEATSALRVMAPAAPSPSTGIGAEAHLEALRQAREEGYQKGAQDAHQQGYRAGFEQGSRQGMEEGRISGEQEVARQAQLGLQGMKARMERMDQWLAMLRGHSLEQLAQRLHSVEEDVVAIVHAATCRLLGGVALDPANIGAMVRQAIEQCCGAGTEGSAADVVAIHVHPSDLDLLQADPAVQDWLAQQGARGIRWLPEPRVELGGCIVQGVQGSLDARLETQLAALRSVLLSGRQMRVGGGATLSSGPGSERLRDLPEASARA